VFKLAVSRGAADVIKYILPGQASRSSCQCADSRAVADTSQAISVFNNSSNAQPLKYLSIAAYKVFQSWS
jgi:hypothetical protein